MLKKIIIPTLISFILIIGGIVYFLVFQEPAETPPAISEEKTAEEIMQSLTVPTAGENSEVSEKVLKSLSAPGEGAISEDILKSLTAPK